MYLCIQNILFQIFIKNVERKNKLLPQFISVLQETKILGFDGGENTGCVTSYVWNVLSLATLEAIKLSRAVALAGSSVQTCNLFYKP